MTFIENCIKPSTRERHRIEREERQARIQRGECAGARPMATLAEMSPEKRARVIAETMANHKPKWVPPVFDAPPSVPRVVVKVAPKPKRKAAPKPQPKRKAATMPIDESRRRGRERARKYYARKKAGVVRRRGNDRDGTSIRAEIRQAMQSVTEAAPVQIATAIGRLPGSVSVAMREMPAAGELRRVRYGVYVLGVEP